MTEQEQREGIKHCTEWAMEE